LVPATYQLVESLLQTLQWTSLLEQKKTTIARCDESFSRKDREDSKILPDAPAGFERRKPQSQTRGHGRHGKRLPRSQACAMAH
jgi:hypothetical protein